MTHLAQSKLLVVVDRALGGEVTELRRRGPALARDPSPPTLTDDCNSAPRRQHHVRSPRAPARFSVQYSAAGQLPVPSSVGSSGSSDSADSFLLGSRWQTLRAKWITGWLDRASRPGCSSAPDSMLRLARPDAVEATIPGDASGRRRASANMAVARSTSPHTNVASAADAAAK